MSSQRRPYFPWYPKDYVADEKTRGLSDDADLLYRRVLDIIWQANDLQLLNNRSVLLKQIARGWSVDRFNAAWDEVQRPNFELLKVSEDGEWITSNRLQREAQKIEKTSKIRSEAGKKAKAKQKLSKCKANAKQKPNYTDTDTDIKKEVSDDTSFCPEPPASGQPPDTPKDQPIISFPTNKKNETFAITESYRNELAALFPAVDVDQELRSMKAWLMANPERRKTKTGVPRFITSWLAKEQNKGGVQARARPNEPKATTHAQHMAVERSKMAEALLRSEGRYGDDNQECDFEGAYEIGALLPTTKPG